MSFTKDADGIANKGKTKGKLIGNGPSVMGRNGGLKCAGVSSMSMKQVGRNMARVMNQKSSGRGR